MPDARAVELSRACARVVTRSGHGMTRHRGRGGPLLCGNTRTRYYRTVMKKHDGGRSVELYPFGCAPQTQHPPSWSRGDSNSRYRTPERMRPTKHDPKKKPRQFRRTTGEQSQNGMNVLSGPRIHVRPGIVQHPGKRSNRRVVQRGRPCRIRTDTEQILSLPPLPIGLTGARVSRDPRRSRPRSTRC